ncbi:MAG: HAMP domain-containing protein [Acidobacteria bacterium]|nr:HAMP domain-containing protein [Acidobacteriota bacterium]
MLGVVLRGGLRTRLVLLLLVTLVPVLTASTIANIRQRQIAFDHFVGEAQDTTASIAADLDRIVSNAHQLLTALESLPEVRDATPACPGVLAEFLHVLPYLTNVGRVDAHGTVLCSAIPEPSGMQDSRWLARALSEPEFVVADSRPQANSSQREIFLAHAFRLDDGGTAVLYATFGLGWLDRLVGAARIGDGGIANVFDADGQILYRSAQPEQFVGTHVPDEAARRIRESATNGGNVSGLDGVRRRYVVATWSTDARNPMLLAIGFSTAAVLRPFNRVLLSQSLLLLLGTLVATMAVSQAARSLVLGPVRTLSDAVGRVRAGDLTARATPAGVPELKELTETLNLAVEGLQRHREMEEQLRDAQRLQAIGHLAGGVAHEFNNMLTVILGYTEALLNEDPTRPEYRAITESAERARVLTHQLLAFSRKQLLQPKHVGLNAIVRDVLERTSSVLGTRIAKDLELAQPDPLVLVDPEQFAEVVANIVVNAADAMPGAGRLGVRTGHRRLNDGDVSGLDAGDYVELVVTDTGHGMDAATLAHALEPFFTTKPFGRRSGLGLSTAYGIVRQSGGHLTISSGPGEGTTVRIYLPVEPLDLAQQA